MNYDWIEAAMENGGVMTTSRNQKGIKCTMHWKHIVERIQGDYHSTFPDAVNSLNAELADDAGKEMAASGAV